jgi:hypothetical protein
VTVISREGKDELFDLMKGGVNFSSSSVQRSHQASAETTCADETAGITTEVNMPETKHITSLMPYDSSGDFHRIFKEENDTLQRLSLLLTAIAKRLSSALSPDLRSQ